MKTVYYFLVLIILMLYSCEEKRLEPISKSLGKPGQVEILSVEAIAGGAIVTYRIPVSEDILAVKAFYTISNGRTLESAASYYENYLTINGYCDMNEHEAKLYTINRAQEMSDPVIVKFTPLEASLNKVRKTMEIVSDFGGARFIWKNTDRAPLIFEFFAETGAGKIQAMRVINSSAESTKFSLRGYQPEERWFACVVRDFWNNVTDTIYPPSKVIPLFEEKINKRNMSIMKLGNDANWTNWEGRDEFIIDDNRDTFGHSPVGAVPAAFTVDLGATVKLSRFLFFNRNYQNSYYGWGNVRRFDVFTCNSVPSSTGNWDEWTLLMKDCTQIKPSGTPGTTMTDEDIDAALNGFEFEFELDVPPLRYLRFVVTNTWTDASYAHPAELDFYGVVIE